MKSPVEAGRKEKSKAIQHQYEQAEKRRVFE